MKNCETCDCFRLVGLTNGLCHRLPPKVVVVDGIGCRTVWPEVDATEGCGYHVAKPTKSIRELNLPPPHRKHLGQRRD